jgi:hypothetical protein
LWFEATPSKQFERPYLKNTQYKIRAGGVAETVECQPSKHEALNSNPSTAKKREFLHVNICVCMCTLIFVKLRIQWDKNGDVKGKGKVKSLD